MTERTILLVDEHPLTRIGLRLVLEGAGHFGRVEEVGSIEEGARTAGVLRIDVAVVSLRLPDGSAVDAIRTLREVNPSTRVVVLAAEQDDDAVMAAFAAGARGFLLKTMDPALIEEWLTSVAEGGFALGPIMTQRLLERYKRSGHDAERSP